MPILQIVTFKTSEEFKASQLVLKQALEIVFAVKGCDSIHYGHQEEDKGETGYLLIRKPKISVFGLNKEYLYCFPDVGPT